MQGKIVLLDQGVWGPYFNEPYTIVGTFLWADVQRSVKSCDYYLFSAREIATGAPPIEIRGNLHIVRIMPTWVIIGNFLQEKVEPIVISHDAFLSILRYWKSIVSAWLRRDKDLPNDAPEFSYDDPNPVPELSIVKANQEFQEMLLNWHDVEKVHHRGRK